MSDDNERVKMPLEKPCRGTEKITISTNERSDLGLAPWTQRFYLAQVTVPWLVLAALVISSPVS
jgi:hypothetical protein